MSDDLPPVMSDADEAEEQEAALAYVRTLAEMERDGASTTLALGPLAAVNMLSLLDFAAKAPGDGQAEHRAIVDDLAGQLAPAGIGLHLIGATVQETTEVMRELAVRERGGERHPVQVGPFTAMRMIGLLQMATRHPDLDGGQRQLVRQFVAMMAPLFTGTPGEAIIAMGWHPEFDR